MASNTAKAALIVGTSLCLTAPAFSASTLVQTTTASPTVEEVQWRRHHHWRGHHPRWRHSGDRWVGPAIGFGTGLIIGNALAQSRGYDRSVQYCMQRFKSYDPASGTYLGYDGNRHPCP